MDLVESALTRDGEARAAFLETIRTRHPDLYEEVMDRVEWEARMGGFLRDPLMGPAREAASNTRSRPFSVGQLVGNRFRILRQLRPESKAILYQATDEILHRTVALKCLSRPLPGPLKPLTHPHLSKIYELHTTETDSGPVDFVSMEFVEGDTLRDHLKREGPITQDKAHEIVLQICAGLAYAHRQGVCHGDLTTASVILGPPGAVVTGCGVSKASVASDVHSLRSMCDELALKVPPRATSVDDVIAILNGSRKFLRRALVVAIVAIAILAAYLWNVHPDTGPPVLLAILPITIQGGVVPGAEGLPLDIADRLSGARANFIVTSDHADATHILRTNLHVSGGQITASSTLIDVATNQPLRETHGDFVATDLAEVANSLVASVSAAFALRSSLPPQSTTGPAYSNYVQGLALLRRNDQNPDEAIAHFAAAAQLDPHSALPYAGLAEAQLQKTDRGEGSQWLDLAAENVEKAKSIDPGGIEVLRASALLHQAQGRCREAIAEFKQLARRLPASPEAKYRQSLCRGL
jgi:hypothetical protein